MKCFVAQSFSRNFSPSCTTAIARSDESQFTTTKIYITGIAHGSQNVFADGIVKGYDYNGTRAPIKTTFYGALDRYYSFDKKFPFNLPSYFEKLPKEFDPSTPLNFVSTNDIVGGNSGSAVINKNAEIVGLAFDGNIESLPSNFIYTTEANRTVCVSALGMMEAIRDLYKATRLSDELSKGSLD